MARRTTKRAPAAAGRQTVDTFQNFLSRTGYNTGNLSDGASYGFNPISRNRLQLEWAYRGNWIVGQAVDTVAEDMTRDGVEINSAEDPEQVKELEKSIERLQVWTQLCDGVKWGRLYGGAIAVLMIDGQDPATPLNVDRIGRGQFRGLMIMDRWMVQPSLSDLVEELGPSYGLPRYYDTVVDQNVGLPRMKVHYSRCIRLEGTRLPFWQRISENLWANSVIERLWDRLIAFDSATLGAGQLTYKAHLRTYAVEGLRDIIAMGGKAYEGLVAQINAIRQFQANEGITLIDTKDEFETHQYTFAGLSDVILQFAQQVSGSLQIPLVRLLGQSPAGMNSTGESDLRTYYDGIKSRQETTLRPGVELVYDVAYRSRFGRPPPENFGIEFKSLWQMTQEQRATVTNETTGAIAQAFESQIIDRSTAAKELKTLGNVTGTFSTITDEYISEAENDPAPSPEALGLEIPKPVPGRNGAPGSKPAAPNGKG